VFKKRPYQFATTRRVAREAGLPDHFSRYVRRFDDPDLQRIVGRLNPASGITEWSPLNAGMFFLLADLLKQGVKAPLAAKWSARVMDAHEAAPDIAQWAIVVTENGNTSTLAFDSIDLSSGYISGSRLAFALIVDLRLYDERVERLFAQAEAERDRVLNDA
jgi:hypothetical protein